MSSAKGLNARCPCLTRTCFSVVITFVILFFNSILPGGSLAVRSLLLTSELFQKYLESCGTLREVRIPLTDYDILVSKFSRTA